MVGAPTKGPVMTNASPAISLVILYVDDPAASAAFYQDLLARPPAEASPTFAMFPMPAGAGLGLWSRHTVEPAASAAGGGGGGGGEVAFVVADVDAVHAAWSAKGLRMIQPPTELDFGRTCVALDPDGHRLRAFTPNGR